MEQMDRAAKSDGNIRPHETRVVTKRGDVIDIHIWGRLFGGHLVVLINDVTHEKKQQRQLADARDEAEAANLAKSEFLSRMSHELRTPLNGIIGFSKLLELANLPERQANNVRCIHEAGNHLLELINEVLDISRIEAGHLGISSEGVDVDALIVEVIGLVEPLAREREIAVAHEKASDPDLRALADRQRLRQILLNLASNAIKYNRDRGSVTLAVDITGQNRVRVEVRDTGPGIPKEKQARLFTPFDRLDAERERFDVEGTGLGLALSKKLAEVMAGAISVESRPGEGSIFAIELGRAEGTVFLRRPASGAARETKAEDANGDPRRLTMLYIEDNPDNLELIRQVVEQRPGVRLLAAARGDEGVDLARQRRPDLIFLDFHLPGLNGDEVLRKLKADERTRNIPVYMLSADAMSGQIKRLKELGATDYLTKPLDIERFLILLDEAAARKERDKS